MSTSLRLPFTQLAGGLNQKDDPAFLDPSEATICSNLRPVGGVLESRDGLMNYCAVSTSWAHPITKITPLLYSSGTSVVAFHSYRNFYTYDGVSVTDRSGSGVIASGTDDDIWDACVGDNTYFFTNGIEELLCWDGTSAACSKVSSDAGFEDFGSSDPPIGRYLTYFAGRVILGYTVENSTNYPSRIRWSEPSTSLGSGWMKWDDAAGEGAGFTDLADTPGPITGLCKLGNQLLIFKYDSVWIGRETGDVSDPIAIEKLFDTGCLTGRSYQPLDPNTGIFLGKDNLYIISGISCRAIGDKIRNTLFSTIDLSRARKISSGIRRDRSVYYLTVPEQGITDINLAYCYNYSEDKFHTEYYLTGVTEMSVIDLSVTPSIDSYSGTIDSYSGMIDSYESGASSPALLFGVNAGACYRIHLASPTVTTDSVRAGSTELTRGFAVQWYSGDIRPNPEGYSDTHSIKLHYSSSDAINLVQFYTNSSQMVDSSYLTTLSLEGTRQVASAYVRQTGIFHRFGLYIENLASKLYLYGIEKEFILRTPLR